VAGPDGNVWFTEAGAARIGRLNPSTIGGVPTLSTWGLLLCALLLVGAGTRLALKRTRESAS
jgi:hypothetical protein